MSQHNRIEQIPLWLWISFVPILGGLVHIYAGWRTKTMRWVHWGGGFILSSLILGYLHPPLIWLVISAQGVTAFSLKKSFLIATAPKTGVISPTKITGLLPENRENKEPIDINKCTKDEMVYDLGLSIIYANDIEMLRHEGYMFTDIDELVDIVGIPESIVRQIEPLIVFRYYEEQDLSWRRLNSFSVDQLVEYDIDRSYAEKIVTERNNKGTYQSLLDVRKRTGIPINIYRHLA